MSTGVTPLWEVLDFRLSSPLISADIDRLQQIIRNLLSNAVKFRPSGAHSGQPQARGVSCGDFGEDSGIGIDPQFIPFVFDRFRQANSATTRSHGGLGLGLNIVRKLVNLQDGTIFRIYTTSRVTVRCSDRNSIPAICRSLSTTAQSR
jgi:signal transduction histidine kinase